MNSYVYFYAVLLSVVQLLQDTADGYHSMEAEYRVKDVIYLQVKYPHLVLSLSFLRGQGKGRGRLCIKTFILAFNENNAHFCKLVASIMQGCIF